MKTLFTLAVEHPMLASFIFLVILVWLAPSLLGVVFIRERQVGIIIKKFGAHSLPPGRLIAVGGEAGYQAETLAPGLHFGFFRWQYRIIKAPVTVVPQGEIALVVAAFALKSLLIFAALSYAGMAVARVSTAIRRRLIAALFDARWSFHTDRHTGHIANVMSSDATRAGDA